mgnify:CR=1 FL=1
MTRHRRYRMRRKTRLRLRAPAVTLFLLACLLPFLCAAILTTPLVYAATAWSIQLMLRARRRKESHHA